ARVAKQAVILAAIFVVSTSCDRRTQQNAVGAATGAVEPFVPDPPPAGCEGDNDCIARAAQQTDGDLALAGTTRVTVGTEQIPGPGPANRKVYVRLPDGTECDFTDPAGLDAGKIVLGVEAQDHPQEIFGTIVCAMIMDTRLFTPDQIAALAN